MESLDIKNMKKMSCYYEFCNSISSNISKKRLNIITIFSINGLNFRSKYPSNSCDIPKKNVELVPYIINSNIITGTSLIPVKRVELKLNSDIEISILHNIKNKLKTDRFLEIKNKRSLFHSKIFFAEKKIEKLKYEEKRKKYLSGRKKMRNDRTNKKIDSNSFLKLSKIKQNKIKLIYLRNKLISKPNSIEVLFKIFFDGYRDISPYKNTSSTKEMGIFKLEFESEKNKLRVLLKNPKLLINEKFGIIFEIEKYLKCKIEIIQIIIIKSVKMFVYSNINSYICIDFKNKKNMRTQILIGGQALKNLGSDRHTNDVDYLINDKTTKEQFITSKKVDFLNANGSKFFNEIFQIEKNNEQATPQSLFELKAYAFVQHCQNFNWAKADACEYDLKFLVRNFECTAKIVKKYILNGELNEIIKIEKSVKKYNLKN